MHVYVCVCVDESGFFTWVCIVFENVYQRYMYSNTHFPVEKHIYVYIVSIYYLFPFAYNMQTATWWSDSTEVHLKDGGGGGQRGEGRKCVHGRDWAL